MKRTKLADREYTDYTKGEEIFNMVSHIVGAAIGVAVLTLCVVYSAVNSDAWAVVSSCIYGASMILLYTVSSVYHGLRKNTGKKVMQVIDHCMIYYLISGTYTPVVLCALRPEHPVWAWVIFGIVWGCAATATVFTAIDWQKYSKMSMFCYLGMGWCIVFAIKPAVATIAPAGLWFIFLGGVAYTLGAVLYGLGNKIRYMHSMFHLFVIAGSVLQFFGIIFYVL